jgi:hypothetical protein
MAELYIRRPFMLWLYTFIGIMHARHVGLYVAGLLVAILTLMYVFPDFDVFRRDHMMTSSVDHEAYLVQEEYENKQAAANILADINQMYVRVITHLKRNRIGGPYGKQIAFLATNYNPTTLGEHIPSNLKYTSYVAQKGKKIRMCLRIPEDRRKFHDMNTLKFVALHELTHMAVESYGHETQFWDTFRFILSEAASIGEIKLVDYSKNPVRYCGIMIESSPIYA